MQVCQREQEVAPGHLVVAAHRGATPDAVEPVEGSGEDQPLDDRFARPRPRPEVAERDERLARDDAFDLRLGDALDVGEREADAPALYPGQPLRGGRRPHGEVLGKAHLLAQLVDEFLEPFGPVLARAAVHVEAEHRDVHPSRLLQQQPLRVHAWIVGEDAGEEVRRVVALQPG